MKTLISPDNHILILSLLCLSAYIGIVFDRYQWLKAIPGIVITMICGALLSNFNILPIKASVYDLVWDYFIPIAIPFILLRTNFKEVVQKSGPTMWAFAIGTVGTMLGGLVAHYLVSVGPESWKIVGMFTGTYIGGSINLVSISKIFELQDNNLFLAGNAADNVLMAMYFVVLSLIGTRFGAKDKPLPTDGPDDAPTKENLPANQRVELLLMGLTLSLIIFGLATLLNRSLNVNGFDVILITLLTLGFAQLFPRLSKKLTANEGVGYIFLQIFFAVIGVSCQLTAVIEKAPKLFAMLFIMLTFQLTFMLIGAKIFRIGMKETTIAANALAGGPATAVAMANNHKWNHLLVPAILCGTLGYGIGTFLGVALGAYIR